ncbi:hypothetical protein ACI79C_04050 [Geodermatophilus sp. SYSU D00697]
MTLPDRDAARDWVGATVVDRDGEEIGVCAALLADEATGLPEWLYAERDEVTVVVPLLDATGSGDRVQVSVPRADVDAAPRFGPSRELSQEQEAELYRHYGIEYSRAGSESVLPTEAEPAGAESVQTGPTQGATAGAAPDADDDRLAGSDSAGRGRSVAAAVLVLVGLAAAVVAAVRRRGRPVLGSAALWRRAPARRRPAPRRAAVGTAAAGAAARARAAALAAAAGPVLAASGRLAREGASAGARSVGGAAVDAARWGREASTAARTYTDEATARLAPWLATTGEAAWRAARAGTDSALQATGAATGAVVAALPRVAAGAGHAGRTGLHALLTVGAAAEAAPKVLAETGERLEKGWRRGMGRLSLALGFGVGYVLGARAGQDRYEQIKQAAAGVVERPEVQQALDKARTAAPAPLQGSIDKLTGRASGRHYAGTDTAGTDTADAEGVTVEGVDVVVPPPAPATGTAGPRGTDAPVPDPLIPPAKSNDGPTAP